VVDFPAREVRVTSTEMRNSIRAVNDAFVAAFARSDAAGMAAVYTDDAEVLPPNSNLVSGRPAIQAFWQGVLNLGLKAAELKTVEVGGGDDLAYEVGTYRLMAEGNQVADHGKYVVVWKRKSGIWKIHRDIWNSSVPTN
jgi:uncharacterized protein (TIGR02246 family)